LICWEIMTVLSFFLIIFEKKVETKKPAILYFFMSLLGTVFISTAFFMLYKQTGHLDFLSFYGKANALTMSLACIGFAIKAGLFPLHTWLAEAHPVAPTSVSALMSGVMVKVAVYGAIRFLLYFRGENVATLGIVIMFLGAVSALMGIMLALSENDVKKLLAYSTIENMGIIFAGIGLTYWSLSQNFNYLATLAFTAVLLHVVNHGLFKSLMFMISGVLIKYTHTRNMEKLGGLAKRMPILAIYSLVGVMAMCAFPPLNGFISEWFLYQSLIGMAFGESVINSYFAILTLAIITLTGAIAGVTFLKFYGIVFLGKPRTLEAENSGVASWYEKLVLAIPVALCIFIGIFPQFLLAGIARLTYAVTGQHLQQSFSFINIENNGKNITSLYPTMAVVAFVVVMLGVWVIIKIRAKGKVRRAETWACGLSEYNSQAQFSAKALTQGIRRVFSMFYSTVSAVRFEDELKHFRRGAIFEEQISDPIDKYIIINIPKIATQLSDKFKSSFQTGNLNFYIASIFFALIVSLTIYWGLS